MIASILRFGIGSTSCVFGFAIRKSSAGFKKMRMFRERLKGLELVEVLFARFLPFKLLAIIKRFLQI
jgi:hypothetical protein